MKDIKGTIGATALATVTGIVALAAIAAAFKFALGPCT